MRKKQKFSACTIMLAFITALALFLPCSVLAQADYESFRQDLIEFVEIYGTGADAELIAELRAMSFEDLQAYHSALSDPSLFAQANELAKASQARQEALKLQPDLSQLPTPFFAPVIGFTPDYPSGGNYSTYTATLPGLGILLAGSQNRTDASAVGGAWIAFNVLEFLAITAQATCDGGLVLSPGLCSLSGIAQAAARADQVVLEQADYQDALIDGAEIEAAFENSKLIIGQANALSTELATHDADIKSQLTTHDTDIKGQLTTHDTDIKALLVNIQAGVDANGAKLDIMLARQLEVVRLLHTPEGRRASDVPACNGGPCSWNK